MKIEKNDMVMVYDGGGTVPHCKYTGRFGDLTAYWQEIVSDAVYLFRLGESEECDCVIKPTGTGKFVIIAKMVQDNPDKRFLLLGTNDYMFNDQMANLAEIAPGFTPENLQFMTCSAAMMTARRGEEISGYDVVVADEFHHCGAEEWERVLRTSSMRTRAPRWSASPPPLSL